MRTRMCTPMSIHTHAPTRPHTRPRSQAQLAGGVVRTRSGGGRAGRSLRRALTHTHTSHSHTHTHTHSHTHTDTLTRPHAHMHAHAGKHSWQVVRCARTEAVVAQAAASGQAGGPSPALLQLALSALAEDLAVVLPAGGGAGAGVAASNGASNGVTSNGASSNGATSNGAASNGATSNGAASNGTTSNGAASNSATSNGAASNGATSNGATSNGASSCGGQAHGSGGGDAGCASGVDGGAATSTSHHAACSMTERGGAAAALHARARFLRSSAEGLLLQGLTAVLSHHGAGGGLEGGAAAAAATAAAVAAEPLPAARGVGEGAGAASRLAPPGVVRGEQDFPPPDPSVAPITQPLLKNNAVGQVRTCRRCCFCTVLHTSHSRC